MASRKKTRTSRKTSIANFAIVCALCLPALMGCRGEEAVAGDASDLSIIGWSPDGRFMAYELYGVQDGSGFPYSEVYIVDVPANDFVGSAFKMQASEADDDIPELDDLRRQNLAAAHARIRELNIQTTDKGKLLVYHPLTDVTTDGYRVRFATGPDALQPVPGYAYELLLDERETGDTCYEFRSKMLTLTLANDKQRKVLQHDKRLPRSRGCVFKYRIERVIVHGEQLAVFLHAFLPGFEGPNVRHLVVTGTLDFGAKL